MPVLQQGSVIWAELELPFGRRPVVVLTRDAVLRRLNAVAIAPVTRTIRNIDTEVILQPVDGVPTTCVVTLDNIFTIPREALAQPITHLSREKLLLIFTAIRAAFDMP